MDALSARYGALGRLQTPYLEKAYAVAIAHTQLSLDVQARLYNALLTPSAIWSASPDLVMPYFKVPAAFERFMALRQQLNPQALLEQYATTDIQVLTPMDADYPERLKVIHHAPPVLFVRGNLELLKYEPGVSIVGTRKVTPYGQQMTAHLVQGLEAYQANIVSGLAAGVDTIAHQTALQHGLPTVAVFGTGMDIIFPKSNLGLAQQILDGGGALVTELPLGTLPRQFNFPNRNRIIAGLTMGTLVVEAPERSGALITSRVALEEGRNVMTIAANNFSPTAQGCLKLLQQGASLVTSAEDIANVMGWAGSTGSGKPLMRPRKKVEQDKVGQGKVETSLSPLSPSEPQLESQTLPAASLSGLSDSERAVFELIPFDPIPREVIETTLALPVPAVQQALTMLELHGVIQALPGNHFARLPNNEAS